jgi:predicted HicB family RNase H-like nuclease
MSQQLLTHNGYHGSIEFSIEDGVLHGKVLDINDLVTYEAENLPALQKAFAEAVENYLVQCRALGVDPNKPYSGTFNVRLTAELHKLAALCAARKGTSLNEFVRTVVEAATCEENEAANHVHYHIHHELKLTEESAEFEAEETQWQSREKPKSEKQSKTTH